MSIDAFELAPGIVLGRGGLPVIAGPCVIEGSDWLVRIGQELGAMSHRLGLPIIFKSSFDKANRSSGSSFRGPGLADGLQALAQVREASGLPVLTDVHEPDQCAAAAEVCDVLQIPAFLCRQTDLVVAAASTGRPLLIKKGQFMAPADMVRVVDKARTTGNARVAVTERGSSFGYRNLVVDMRSFAILAEHGIACVYDVTHSLQLPGAREEESGGDRRFAEPLARAAIAAGAQGLYLETHPDPDRARCDRETQLPHDRAERLLLSVLEVHRARIAEGPWV